MKAISTLPIFVFLFFFFYANAQDIKILDQSVTGMVYVEQLDRIFIVVGSDSGPNSNSICMVDPYFGKIERSFFVGNNPRELAVSDDGKYLYTTLSRVNKILRFNTETESIDLEIPLGGDEDFLGPFYAEDIEVMPGHPTTIAVSLTNSCCSPRHEGVAIFDEDVQRPMVTPGHTGSNRIEFAESDTILFGYNNETTDFGFRTMTIVQNGLSITRTQNGLISGFGVDMEYGNGYIFSTNGSIIDVSGAAPERISLLSISGVVGVVPDSNIVHYLSRESNGIRITTIELTTFGETDNFFIPNVEGNVQKAIVWGEENNIAFYTNPGFGGSESSKLVFFRNCTSEIQTAPQITPGGNVVACTGTPVTLVASGFDNYFWSDGSTNDTLTTLISGDYRVATLDSEGCAGPFSNIVRVSFENLPSRPGISGGDLQTFCAGGFLDLSASGFGGSLKYLWSNGMEGQRIRIDSAGTYSVRSISAIGCISNPSTPVIVQQLTDSVPPRPILEIVGDTALCTGERSQLFAPEGYSRYHWERIDDNYGSFSSTDNSVEVSFTSSYSVSLENEVGCLSAPSDTVSIIAYRTPGQPVVQVNNNLLACSIIGDSYRWYLNDELIEGANERFYEATQSGFYSVEVIINGCTSPVSQLKSVISTSLEDLEEDLKISLYPNPASEWLNIESFSLPLGRIVLAGVDGHQSLKQEIIPSHGKKYLYDMSNLPSGVYVIQLFDKNNHLIKADRVIKLAQR